MNNASPQSPRIFISHSGQDNDFCRQLASDLRTIQGSDLSVWLDIDGGLYGGNSWIQIIEQEVSKCTVFIVILSPEATKSRWVNQEIDIAVASHNPIIPVLYRQCEPRPLLKTLQIINFQNPKPYTKAFDELKKALLLLLSASPQGPSTPKTAVFLQTIATQVEAAFFVGHWNDVIRKVDYMISQDRHAVSSRMYQLQGMAYFNLPQLEQAHEAVRIALALVNDQQERLSIMRDYATVLNRQERWKELLYCAQEVLKLAPGDSWWPLVQATAQRQLHRLNPPPPQPQPSKPGERLLGAYRVVQRMEQSMAESNIVSETYQGEHIYHKHGAIITLFHFRLSQQEIIDFQTEADDLKRLGRPQVVRLLDVGLEHTQPFLAYEPVLEPSFPQKHGNNARLALEDVKYYIWQLATILQDMHDAGVIHGNIRPESILIKPDQSLVLADARPPLIMQRFRSTYGRTVYMAPEEDPTVASDQYALGILVYEWLTGHPPTPDALESLEMAKTHSYILPSTLRELYRRLSKDAERAIVTALAREPHHRYDNVMQFAHALKKG